jgi:hypothetical protein
MKFGKHSEWKRERRGTENGTTYPYNTIFHLLPLHLEFFRKYGSQNFIEKPQAMLETILKLQ